MIEKIHLIFTSPPFALLRKKDYGNVNKEQWRAQKNQKVGCACPLADTGSASPDVGAGMATGTVT